MSTLNKNSFRFVDFHCVIALKIFNFYQGNFNTKIYVVESTANHMMAKTD